MQPLAERIAEARRVLHGCYGFSDFRPPQRRVVQSVLAGRDTLAILPTGGGKSICFQVPGLVLGGLTLVISPLVALMQDQVAALRGRGIPAATLNSLMDREEQAAVMTEVATRRLRLLYASPERGPRLTADLRELGVRPTLLAIDEAHCISEWGHDFRPAYRALAVLRRELGGPPTVALTGSATLPVQADIIQSLGFGRHDCHRGSFDRPNLWFGVQHLRRRSERLPALRTLLASRPGAAIVYVPTRNSTDAVAQALWFAGHRAAAYHAGLTRERRAEVLQDFLGGRFDVVVATSAFGMGIDAPRVRLVVHWGMPPTPEAYYQEAGRAGRDGHPARCILLHHRGDLEIHRRQLEVTFPAPSVLEELWNHPERRSHYPSGVVASADRLGAELGGKSVGDSWRRVEARRRAAAERLEIIGQYAGRRRCRRQALLGYFGEAVESCAGCDRCLSPDAGPGSRLRTLARRIRNQVASAIR